MFYQLKYRIVSPKRRLKIFDKKLSSLDLKPFPVKRSVYEFSEDKKKFTFLNISHSFKGDEINWSQSDHGMLWAYNLNYFDWLHQIDMTRDVGIDSLKCYYDLIEKNTFGSHPYPTSKRIINVSKFVSKWKIKETWLLIEIIADLKLLGSRLEYHLLGNHLLENAIALYIGGLLTNQNTFVLKGKKVLKEQLLEQIFDDGMHYERSPMYHLNILESLIDALNFGFAASDEFTPYIESYVIKMVACAKNWEELKRIPMMQDSAPNISVPLKVLLSYSASILGDKYPEESLDFNFSGYRMIKGDHFHLFANVGNINPSYQPGHSHSDELNYEFFYDGQPIIVDSGISTYEIGARRHTERSTRSHNCVELNDLNSSDVWSAFRVGNRAKVNILRDDEVLKAECKVFSLNHSIIREFKKYNTHISISDSIEPIQSRQLVSAKGRVHFHPSLNIERIDKSSFRINDNLTIFFEFTKENSVGPEINSYYYSEGFNRIKKADVLIYEVSNRVSYHIKFNK